MFVLIFLSFLFSCFFVFAWRFVSVFVQFVNLFLNKKPATAEWRMYQILSSTTTKLLSVY